jgi:hypothetical protein
MPFGFGLFRFTGLKRRCKNSLFDSLSWNLSYTRFVRRITCQFISTPTLSTSCISRWVSVEGDNYFLVVQHVVETERAAVAVFEPFLCGLVTANVKFPGNKRNSVEILRVVYPNAARGFFGIGGFPAKLLVVILRVTVLLPSMG